jgi:hypothetical protein
MVEVTLEIDIDSPAWYPTGLAFYTGTREWNILIGTEVLVVNQSVAVRAIELNTPYTFRFEYDEAGVDVYINGTPITNLQDVAGGTAGYASGIYLHRYTSSVDSNSGATFYEVSWTAIPEPGAVTLAIGGGALLLFGARRNAKRLP